MTASACVMVGLAGRSPTWRAPFHTYGGVRRARVSVIVDWRKYAVTAASPSAMQRRSSLSASRYTWVNCRALNRAAVETSRTTANWAVRGPLR
jgi:hypothetical protein